MYLYRALNVDWFMMQIKHRYDIEIDQAKRYVSIIM